MVASSILNRLSPLGCSAAAFGGLEGVDAGSSGSPLGCVDLNLWLIGGAPGGRVPLGGVAVLTRVLFPSLGGDPPGRPTRRAASHPRTTGSGRENNLRRSPEIPGAG